MKKILNILLLVLLATVVVFNLSAQDIKYKGEPIAKNVVALNLSAHDIKVKFIGGAAIVKKADGKQERISFKTVIRPGDTVITGSRSFVTLEGPDGSVYKVQANTEYKFDKLILNDDGKEQLWFYLGEGKIHNYISKTVKKKDIMFVSKSVVVGVRGTQFSMTGGDQPSEVVLIEGKIDLENRITGIKEDLLPNKKSVIGKEGTQVVEATKEDLEKFNEETPVLVSKSGEITFQDKNDIWTDDLVQHELMINIIKRLEKAEKK